MTTIDIATLRKELASTLNKVITRNKQVAVHTKKGNVIILSEFEYNSMVDTIYLLSQKGMLESIKEGEKEDISTMSIYSPF